MTGLLYEELSNDGSHRPHWKCSPTATLPTSLVPAIDVFTTGIWSASSASKTLQQEQSRLSQGQGRKRRSG